jgi:hypothetical protein
MNKTISLAALLFLVFSALPVLAQEVGTNITFKTYMSKYEQSVGDETFSGTSMMFGPVATINYENYYTSITYLTTTTDYKFNLSNGEQFVGNKRDLNIELGYYLGESAAMHIGWKHDVLEMDYSGSPSLDAEIITSGPSLGVTGFVPMAESGITLVGDFTVMYLYTETEVEGYASETVGSNGFSMQLGVKYRLSQRFSLNIGYLHQIYISDESDDTVLTGTYFTVGLGF